MDELEGQTTACALDGAVEELNHPGRGGARKAALRAAALCPAAGPVVAALPEGGYLVAGGEQHSLCIAASGRGKTRRWAEPMLRAIALHGDNLVCNDMKGELLDSSSDLLGRMGYEVHVLDLRRPDASPDSWNPLAHAYELYAAGERDAALRCVSDVATVLYEELDSTTLDKYWTSTSRDLFCGIALHMLERAVGRDGFTLAGVCDTEAELASCGYRELRVGPKRPSPSVMSLVAGTVDAVKETRESIRSVFHEPLADYASMASLRGLLGSSTFSAEDLARPKRALFVVCPDETDAFDAVVTMFFAQLSSSLVAIAQDEYGGRLPVRVHMLMDEFGNLKRVPSFDRLVSAGRSRNLRLHLVVQSLSQITQVYGQAASQAILDNVGLYAYLGSRSQDTNAYFSRMLGHVRGARGAAPEPLMPPEVLQRLETRRDESEGVILLGSLKPYVAALPDISRYVPVRKAAHSVVVSRRPPCDSTAEDGPADEVATMRTTPEEPVFDIDELIARIDRRIASIEAEGADESG